MAVAVALVSRVGAFAVAAFACLSFDVASAYAQSASCQRLESTLATLDRNRDFRNVGENTRNARDLRQRVQRNESAYVRGGCNADAKAGRQLSRECRALAREILDGRQQYDALARSVETGNAVAEQREAILQEVARFGCGSRVRVLESNRNRGNLFEQLFDALSGSFDGEGGFREDEWDPWGNYHTVRTLCVRKSDGFYWPISYATLVDYVPNDADQCRSMCPSLEVELYYYDNPGQEPEQMINMGGEPYSALPNAFKFRTEVDREARCTPRIDYGSITIAQLEDGRSRPMIEYGDQAFPMPLRDPRRQGEITQATLEEQHFVNIPLPRRRPAAPGEEPTRVPLPARASQPDHVVQFGDKRVRIVGPMTPYAQVAAAGS